MGSHQSLRGEGCSGEVTFLKAGSVVHLQSVSPKTGCEILGVGDDAVESDNEIEEDDSGIDRERFNVKKGDEAINGLQITH